MFKVGDKVRFNQDYGYCARKGDTGVVTRVKKVSTPYTEYGQTATHLVKVELTEGSTRECLDFRLDKVSDEPFNVSTATDQELADEYRRLLDLRLPVWEELINRGYLFRDGNNISMTPAASGEEVSITKEERTVISL